MTVNVERPTKLCNDPVRQALCVLRLSDANLDDGELVSAETRQGVNFAHTSPQSVRHGHQEPIADRMAKRIVHLLEIIQIEADYSELGSTARHGDGLFHPFP